MRRHAPWIVSCLALVLGAAPALAADHPWLSAPLRSQQPETYFTNLKDGDRIETPFVLKFGLARYGLAPIVKPVPGAGHHHLLVNRDLPLDFTQPLPFNDQYIHFGKGQMETVINLKPGTYNMSLLLADQGHIPYFVFSRPHMVTITRQNTAVTPASLLGPKRVEMLQPADGEEVRGPFRVQFHASGYNVSHIEPKVADTGHFRLVIERAGKPPELLAFTLGQTEAWLNPPRGELRMRLELVSNTDGKVMTTSAPMRLNVTANSSI